MCLDNAACIYDRGVGLRRYPAGLRKWARLPPVIEPSRSDGSKCARFRLSNLISIQRLEGIRNAAVLQRSYLKSGTGKVHQMATLVECWTLET